MNILKYTCIIQYPRFNSSPQYNSTRRFNSIRLMRRAEDACRIAALFVVSLFPA